MNCLVNLVAIQRPMNLRGFNAVLSRGVPACCCCEEGDAEDGDATGGVSDGAKNGAKNGSERYRV